MTKELTCADRVAEEWRDRREDILFLMACNNNEAFKREAFDEVNEQFSWLGFDYVPAEKANQEQGFYRLQFSYGGPQDEIRFYDNGNIKYWFLDWFDGASIDISDTKEALFIYEWFTGCHFLGCQHVGDSDQIHGPYWQGQ